MWQNNRPQQNGGTHPVHHRGLDEPRPTHLREGIRAARPHQLPRWRSPPFAVPARDHVPPADGTPLLRQPRLEGGDHPVSGESPIPCRNPISRRWFQHRVHSRPSAQLTFVSADTAQLTFVFAGPIKFSASRASAPRQRPPVPTPRKHPPMPAPRQRPPEPTATPAPPCGSSSPMPASAGYSPMPASAGSKMGQLILMGWLNGPARQRPPVAAPHQSPPVPAPRQRPPVAAPHQRPPVPAPFQRPPVPAPRRCPPVPAPHRRLPVSASPGPAVQEPAPFQELAESTPEPAPFRRSPSPLRSPLCSSSSPNPLQSTLRSRSSRSPLRNAHQRLWTSPRRFFLGGYPPWPTESPDPPWPPESPDPPWPLELSIRHWSRNGHRPGGHLYCLHAPLGLQSAHLPSPLDVIRHGTRLLGGGGV